MPQGLFLVALCLLPDCAFASSLGTLFPWALTWKSFPQEGQLENTLDSGLELTHLLCPSTPFCGPGDAPGLAREESPLAGAL